MVFCLRLAAVDVQEREAYPPRAEWQGVPLAECTVAPPLTQGTRTHRSKIDHSRDRTRHNVDAWPLADCATMAWLLVKPAAHRYRCTSGLRERQHGSSQPRDPAQHAVEQFEPNNELPPPRHARSHPRHRRRHLQRLPSAAPITQPRVALAPTALRYADTARPRRRRSPACSGSAKSSRPTSPRRSYS